MTNQRTRPRKPKTVSPRATLVTGATGFVGANLVFQLAAYGHRVIALDLTSPPSIVERFWQEAGGEIIFESGSVTDADRLAKVGDQYRPTVIVHAAAVTAVEATTERQMATRIAEVNIMGTVRLLDLAQRLRVRRILYISSAGLYGTTAPYVRVTEDAPLQISGLYMIAKAASERLCGRYRELFNLDVIIGRLGQPFGPVERDTGVRSIMSPVYQMARGALEGGTTRVPLPDYACDWTYTLDLAEAVRLLVEAETLQHRVYNLSNGQARRLSDVMGQLELLIPGARFEWVGSDEPADVDTRSDPRRGPLDVSRLCQEMNYQSAYSLERGLRAALPWWREMVETSA